MPLTPYLSGQSLAETAELDDASHGVAYTRGKSNVLDLSL
jgi:hypothetical protein